MTTGTRSTAAVGQVVDTYTLHGTRTISRPRQSGYCMEGYVSIAGKRRSCFTSSILFQLPDSRYIDVAVIHARTPEARQC